MVRVKGAKVSRADQARATRRRLIEAAARLFSSDGYASTTMEQIAAEAGVAVQTVYYTCGTKGQLLWEAMEYAAAGEFDPPPVSQRSWLREAMTTTSPLRALAVAVEHSADIYQRAAPLWPAVNAAALEDPAVERNWSVITAERRNGMGRLIARLADLSGLRRGLDFETATDLMFVLNGHGTFHGLVIQADWAVPKFKAWLYSTLVEQLLDPSFSDPSATEGLSFEDSVDR